MRCYSLSDYEGEVKASLRFERSTDSFHLSQVYFDNKWVKRSIE